MHFLRTLSLLTLITSLSACQLYSSMTQTSSSQISTRMQGSLTHSAGQWLFQPCDTQHSYIVDSSTELNQELMPLLAQAPQEIFADISAYIDTTTQHLIPTQRYRLQTQGPACNDPDLARLQLRASGNEPFWSILQTPRGLIFNQIDQASIALPYIEEELGNGRFYISSEANEQNLKLWITPKQCIDSMSGTLYHLQAKLQWNQETLTGCATFGGLRN